MKIPLTIVAVIASTSALAQEATPTPEATASPEATATPEPARDLAAEIDLLRVELERLRDRVDPEDVTTGEEAARGNGFRTVDLAVRAPGRVRFGGVATTAAVSSEEESSRSQIVLPRAAIFAFAPVGDRVSFAGEVGVLGGGAESVDADRGMPGRGDVFLQYAAADLVLAPEWLIVRAGLVMVPLGRVNLRSDESVEELLVRPPAALYVVPSSWADTGAGILGQTFIGGVRLEWQAYVLSGPSSGIDSRTGFRNARQAPGTDRNHDKAIAARVVLEPAIGFELGVSGYSGAYSEDGRSRATLGAVDAAIDIGTILVEGEAVYARTDGGAGALGPLVPEALAGGSAQLTWRFLPDALAESMPDASIGATVRWAFADTDLENPDESPDATDPEAYTRRDRLSVGLSFRPVPRYVLRAEYEFRREAGANFVDDDRAVLSATAAW